MVQMMMRFSLGRDFNKMRNYSEEVAAKIDGEMRRIIDNAYTAAACMGAEQITGLNATQNPFILSFVAVVALFMALKG